MPDWLVEPGANSAQSPLLQMRELATQLTAAFILGCAVAGIYWLATRPTFREGERRGKGESSRSITPFLATLVLLSVLIALTTLVIGNSVARAFSLVGALSIVRFRTVVEDTRDTAFVIFAVVVGMAAGTGYLLAALMGIPFATVAALLFRPRLSLADGLGGESEHTLVVRIGAGQRVDKTLKEVFDRHASGHRLISLVTARQGAALDLTYSLRLREPEGGLALVDELNRLEGIQGVELRRV